MFSMTAMLLPAAGSATVAGARGAAQSLLHRKFTTASFHRSEQQEAPCGATPAAPPGKLPSRAAAGADLSWCACPHLAFKHSTREGAKQSMLMQADIHAAGQPHIRCSTATGTVPLPQASQQAQCRPRQSELQWSQRAARIPRQAAMQQASLIGGSCGAQQNWRS